MATLFGDTSGSLSGRQKGKHQDLVGLNNEDSTLVGDAGESITDSARGGNDTLIGGNNSGSGIVTNLLIGDASVMNGSAQGGNDTLIGGNNSGSGSVSNILIGDADFQLNSAHGGNDRLISGINANDVMWGDSIFPASSAFPPDDLNGGHDTFVFGGAFGDDTVGDFRQGEDKIEFQVAGLESFDDLAIAFNGSDTVISTTVSNDTVTLAGFSGTLTANDILFF